MCTTSSVVCVCVVFYCGVKDVEESWAECGFFFFKQKTAYEI